MTAELTAELATKAVNPAAKTMNPAAMTGELLR